MKKLLLRLGGKAVFKLRGWTFDPLPEYWQPKQVIIGLPHVELLDTCMAFAGYAISNEKGHILVKQEAFGRFIGPLLTAFGAIPVDRAAPGGVVGQMIREFARRETFHLSIVPQGTRSAGATAKMRSGFWHIARGANVPIVCWYLDRPNKRTRWLGQLTPSEDLQADLRTIKAIYAEAGLDLTSIT